MRKIVTHDGPCHADETLAVALLQAFLPPTATEIVRSRVIDERATFVVDVGLQYDGEKYFDHHHDKSLPASCVLIADYLLRKDLMPFEVYNSLLPMMQEISEIDCNGYGPAVSPGNINGLIRRISFQPNGFDTAVNFFKAILDGSMDFYRKSLSAEKDWANRKQLIPGMVHLPVHIPDWKRLAERDGVGYILANKDGKWALISREANLYPIAEDSSNQEFLHASRFMCIFKTNEAKDAHLAKYMIVYEATIQAAKPADA